MKKIGSYVLTFLGIIFCLGIGFGIGYYCGDHQVFSKAEQVENEDSDVKLPGESEKRTITKDEVEAKLVEIGELSTYTGQYSIEKEEDFSKYIKDSVKIPFTTNTVNLSCDGIVKISYNISDVDIDVDEDTYTIHIELPEGYVSDNYLKLDSLECDEKNCILNPIDFSEYEGMFEEMEEEGLAEIEDLKIYDEADRNLKNIIVNFLGAFDGYKVEFI